MYSVLLAGYDFKTFDDLDSENPKRNMLSKRQRVLRNVWLKGSFNMTNS